MATPTTPIRASNHLGGEFRKLWASSAVSNLGDGVALVAAPLLVATLTDDPRLIAALSFVQQLPWLLSRWSAARSPTDWIGVVRWR